MKVIINNKGWGIYSTMAIFALESPVASALISLLLQLYNTSPRLTSPRCCWGPGLGFCDRTSSGKIGQEINFPISLLLPGTWQPSTALLHLIESIVSAEYLICGTGPSVLRNMASLLCRVHTKPPGFKIVQQLHHTLLIINTSLEE